LIEERIKKTALLLEATWLGHVLYDRQEQGDRVFYLDSREPGRPVSRPR
jgi:hypothetical protein